MAFLSSPGFNLGGKVPPTPFYPVNSVVPFYGPTPTTMPTGWTRWAGADGYVLLGGLSATIAGTQFPFNPATIGAAGSFSTGSHTYEQGKIFTTIYHATQSGTAGPAASYLSAGSHTHGNGGTFSYTGQITPDTIAVNFLRSTEITYELPVDSVVFRGAVPTKASATAIATSGRRYITGSDTVAAGTLTSGNRTQFAAWTTTTAGSHYHSPTNNRALGLSGQGFNYDTAFAGTHFHSISLTVTQSIFGTTTLLNAWQILSTLVPESDMIIMYLGSLSSLKAPWYVCDGTKGTINLQNRYVAMSDTATHGSELSLDTTYGPRSWGTSNSNANHAHVGSYLNFKGTTPSSASHQSQFWNHDHSYSLQNNGGSSPPRVALHFIQYKG
jgi:hypothetical protein